MQALPKIKRTEVIFYWEFVQHCTNVLYAWPLAISMLQTIFRHYTCMPSTRNFNGVANCKLTSLICHLMLSITAIQLSYFYIVYGIKKGRIRQFVETDSYQRLYVTVKYLQPTAQNIGVIPALFCKCMSVSLTIILDLSVIV